VRSKQNREYGAEGREREEGQRIDIPWCCELGTAASCGVISVDVSAVTPFDLWVFQCLPGCMLLLLLCYIG
jgi:hypothetical protein